MARTTIRISTMLGFCVSFCLAASATDYHVSPRGADTGPGALEKPWQTVAKVNATAFRLGDRILFEGGRTFSGCITLDKKDSGQENARVVVTSYGKGRATIDGGLGSGLDADGCNYLTVRDINFVGAGRTNENSGRGVHVANAVGPEVDRVEVSGFRVAGVGMESVRNARLTEIYAHDNGASGIEIGGQDPWSEDVYIGRCIAESNPGDPKNLTNHSGNGIVVGAVRRCLIEYCEAMNNGWDMPRRGNGPVGIWAWNADRVIVQHCISHDNRSPDLDGGGFDLDGGVSNSILQYNLSYGNVGAGYLLCQYAPAPAMKNNIVRYNISQNDGAKGKTPAIYVYWCEGMSDCEIYNNTVFNAEGPAVGFNESKAPGIRFRNNIFISGAKLIDGGAEKGEFKGNIYWLINDKSFDVDGHKNMKAWIAATGQERVDGVAVGQLADPRLARVGLANCAKPGELSSLKEYKVSPSSPCIGAGVLIENNGGRDFWGAPVPDKSKPSIGACEKR